MPASKKKEKGWLIATWRKPESKVRELLVKYIVENNASRGPGLLQHEKARDQLQEKF